MDWFLGAALLAAAASAWRVMAVMRITNGENNPGRRVARLATHRMMRAVIFFELAMGGFLASQGMWAMTPALFGMAGLIYLLDRITFRYRWQV